MPGFASIDGALVEFGFDEADALAQSPCPCLFDQYIKDACITAQVSDLPKMGTQDGGLALFV